jgi:hypothetical protein
MTNKQLRRRLRLLVDRADCLALLADLKDVEENCNGTIAECFVAGCVNALDMVDEGTLGDGREFVDFALSEVLNRYSMAN